jgi:hypothetical protein
MGNRRLAALADAVEKLGSPRYSLSPQKNDFHNRSILDDPLPENIKAIPKNRPKIRYLSFLTESADSPRTASYPQPAIPAQAEARSARLHVVTRAPLSGTKLNSCNRPPAAACRFPQTGHLGDRSTP